MSNKNFNFYYLLVGVMALLLGISTSNVNAEEASSYCYAIDDLGPVDLSELCIKSPRSTNRRSGQKLSVTDRDFIEAYKQEINELPAIRDNILAKLDRSPIRRKGSEAASKCHMIAETLGKQAVQLKNPENCNLPVNNGWAVYKSHDRIGNQHP